MTADCAMARPPENMPIKLEATRRQQSCGASPLHDGANATETMFEHQLDLVRTATVLPLAGIFGPESLTWRINREAIIFAAAGRALLLQLAHPWVAAAVADHSHALTDPIGRFHRTFSIVFAMVFGSVDQAVSAARRLRRRHALVAGTLPRDVGPFKAGSQYYANNISALRWVHATLIDSAIAAHDLVFAPLTTAERERYYAESRLLAALFGIPQALLPPTYTGFTAYVEAMCHSDILTVSTPARSIARQIFAGGGTWLRAPMSYEALTFEMLPEPLRKEFGFSYGVAERRTAERVVTWIRRMYPMLPSRIRYVGPYQEAIGRLSGCSSPDAATRLLNRFWIGSYSIAD